MNELEFLEVIGKIDYDLVREAYIEPIQQSDIEVTKSQTNLNAGESIIERSAESTPESPERLIRFSLPVSLVAAAACIAVVVGCAALIIRMHQEPVTLPGESAEITAEADTTPAITEQTTAATTTTDTARTAAAEPEGRTNFTTDGKGAAAHSSAPPAPDTTVTITTTSAANTTTATATTTTKAAATTTTTTLPLNTVCYTPPFYKWHDFSNGEIIDGFMYRSHKQRREAFVLDIYPNIEFGWSNIHDDIIDVVENGETVKTIQTFLNNSAYFSDLNNDGYPELCLSVTDNNYGGISGYVPMVIVYDVINHQEYRLADIDDYQIRFTNYQYQLEIVNGMLLAKRSINCHSRKAVPEPDYTEPKLIPETYGTIAIDNGTLVFNPIE